MSYGSESNVSARTPSLVANWQDAQRNASRWMRAWGFWDAIATSPGTDRGIDIRASGAIGQVMFQAAGVEREALHELVGATADSSQDQLFFFTGTYYSRAAIAYADQCRIALFTYDLDGSMTPQNSIARLVIRSPEVTGDASTRRPHRRRPSEPCSRWTARGPVGLGAGVVPGYRSCHCRLGDSFGVEPRRGVDRLPHRHHGVHPAARRTGAVATTRPLKGHRRKPRWLVACLLPGRGCYQRPDGRPVAVPVVVIPRCPEPASEVD